MADNVDLFEVVPPSPVNTSTQISQRTSRLPLFPRLPSLDLELDISEVDVEPLSPIATVYAGQRNQNNSGNRTHSTSGSDLSDWLIRERREPNSRDVQPGQAVDHVIELLIDDDNSRPSSVNSEVISIADGSSDIEHISDSGDDAADGDRNDDTVVNRPANPEPPEELGEPAGQISLEDHAYPSNTSVQTSDVAPAVAQVTEPSTVTPVTPGPSTVTPLPIVQVLGGQGQSPADFRSPKRKRVHSPEKSSVSGDKKVEEDEDEGETCPICFDTWTTSGLHRLCSLRCGHLFGQSCIEKWLKGQGGKCPQCNAKAKRQDIRVLYAKSIKALDTSERDRALKDLEKERDAKRKAEMEGAQIRLQYQMTIEENNRLKLEIEMLKSQLRKSGGTGAAGLNVGKKVDSVLTGLKLSQVAGQFVLDKTIKIWDAGNCRVMAHCPSLATIVASQPSSSPLFPGFGVKKICTLDFKTSQYITIHNKAIRDVAFHPTVEDGMLLSCGLDKKVKMTSLLSNAVVQTYETAMPAWSCVWNAQDRNYFYAGQQNGLVLEFDIRNTEGPVQEFNSEGSRSPVASLCYMTEDMSADFRSGGLLIGQLDKLSFFEKLPNNQHRLHLLPLEGSLTSLHIEPNTRHILASYRPTVRHPTIRHQLCELISRNISTEPTVIDNVCSCNVIHTFHGGRTQTVLSKTIVQQHPADKSRLLVCAGDETNNSVHLWDSATGQLSQRLITGGVTVDMCSMNINNTSYLAALTDKQLKVYKWT
ncbi:E3 ubiquitin-protein ligase RFWD3-like [Ruditapes philippinarum]|uniref:E3 ubiquitin-protein ligase RFWD3-like n=1 Tax=Ruditapes philippinarum TaxID=129788 RepID=UPI00295B74FD|nr:E3 ubiquitin-protein ligase RFWD3-like [Ruditapes philippinarum]XP_060588603.1 E3 ubiquitin-protein ligase RFWD3-like [Ruditapes philippinarum]